MANYEEYYKARTKIVELVRKDLIGPVKSDEVLIEEPTKYYVMGKLYPGDDSNDQQDDSDDISTNSAVDQNTDLYDTALASSNMRDPSTMGITFTLKRGVQSFTVHLSYALYKTCSLEEARDKGFPIEKHKEEIKENTVFWARHKEEKSYTFSTERNARECVVDQVYLGSYIHKTFETGECVITLVLSNEHKVHGYDFIEKNRYTLYQPEIVINSVSPGTPIFTTVRRQIDLTDDDELLELDMLYDHGKCYGQGHGCAVEWNLDCPEPTFLRSSFMPQFNLLQMKAAEIEGLPVFNMKYLFTAPAEEVIHYLLEFVGQYDAWIYKLQHTVDEDPGYQFKEIASTNLQKCIDISGRIRHAITKLHESLDSDRKAWDAFRYANEAMYLQRKQSLIKGHKTPDDELINWYPFQLAFILLEIPSFIEAKGEDRKLVDLLWFPTGGGKTEAYLGIAAFVIFYRRLSHETGMNGVTVLMRYTLRLLTIQQFERASILICACELLRKKYSIPGDEISIGLWVGNKLTPGSIDEADTTLSKLRAGAVISSDEADPCQIKICPWCGGKLYHRNYSVNSLKKRMTIQCENPDCDFCSVESLPIHLIDEEIYEYRPSFIVATVDKFAQITLQDRPSALFSTDGKNLPPELIIQDELHLISGPLGTMTGIYEAAITEICCKDDIPVKIIASTATIRNAEKQILALYGRKFAQFPPQGISSDNAFFAVKSEEEERPARMYVGCMGVGATFTTTLIRIYAAWLFASRYLIDLGFDEKVIDNFWTLTGYFNSIRELGGAQTQVVDDIQSRYQYLKNTKFANLTPAFTGNNKYEYSVELTSRMTNDDISDVIQTKLKIPYKHDNYKDAFDFVLASNMISVGVDVGRLGTMVVAGQPKTNAEYIQATSRVGRDNPGLVFMVYNASRSRDRSHYEQFMRYHSAMYRYVEATSLTPFSDRARDRGLQALFVTLCRYLCPDLLDNNSAGNFNPESPEVQRVEELIYQYVNIVDSKELNNVIREIKDIEKKWYGQTQGELWYHRSKKRSLLKPDIDEDDRFRCMNSMRSVEKQSGIYLIPGE